MKQEKALFCSNCGEITVASRTWLFTTSKWRCGQCGGTNVIDNDPVANTLLREAKILRGKNDIGAVSRLREVVEKYPETDAAKSAEKMLAKMGVSKSASEKKPGKIVDVEAVPMEKKGLGSLMPKRLGKRNPPADGG